MPSTLAERSPAAGEAEGVQFPLSADDRRSSTAASAQIMASAVRALSPALADAMLAEPRWRERYGQHLVALVELAVRSGATAVDVARDGLRAAHDSFQFLRDGESLTPREALRRFAEPRYHTHEVAGGGARQHGLAVPWRGELLSGERLRRQIDAWRAAGVLEPSAAEALHAVCTHQAWLDLRDLHFALLGAGAELGPLAVLSRLGANVVAVDVDRPAVWRRILAVARGGAGRLLLPVTSPLPADADDERIAAAAGSDLLTMAPEVRTWLASLDRPLCLGAYAYLHGQDHVRVEVAMDAIMASLAEQRRDVTLAFLLTPTDVFAVPEEAALTAREDYARAGLRGLWRHPLRTLTRGRLYAPNCERTVTDPDGHRFGLFDGVVPAQGPNYSLAKRIQRWRALSARADGIRVSANVAPATATASVLARRAFAAAYAGAAHYGVDIFEPATSNAIMAALLIHDLRSDTSAANPTVPLAHPLELFMDQAVHGGVWRIGYRLRSVLEIAALRGLASGLRKRP